MLFPLLAPTLAFVRVARDVRDGGFTVDALDYLLRHQDETGSYRANDVAVEAMHRIAEEGVVA